MNKKRANAENKNCVGCKLIQMQIKVAHKKIN